MDSLPSSFPVDDVANKIALSLLLGLMVGFEREWAQKEIGVRTFAVTSLLGTLSCLVSESMALTAFGGIFLTVLLVNVHSLLRDRSLELTTSVAMMLIFILGVLIGDGHFFTGATGGILLTMLLAWKVEMARFADQLKPNEIRGAVVLGLLSFVIYPLLPNRFIDSTELFNPRQAWITIVAIAGIGFVNYIFLRLFHQRGLYYAAFLGGLVNSTLMVVELSPLVKNNQGEYDDESERILFLTNVAMFLRNFVLLSLLAPRAASSASVPLLATTLSASFFSLRSRRAQPTSHPSVVLPSPVALRRVAKTSAMFVALAALGTLAQRHFGDLGFFAVSVLGGLLSSASATATAAALATTGNVTYDMAAMATLFASIASSMGSLPLIFDQTRDARLTRRLSVWTCVCALSGLCALFATQHLAHE